jgi:HemY protein
MRAALWFLALFGVAVAIALFAGNNQGTITLFWPPWRLDLSLNLVLLLLAAAFVLLHVALRALAALFDLPTQALRWRTQQRERAMHMALLDGLSNLLAGRFIRARKASELALAQEQSLSSSGHTPSHAAQVRSLAHLLAAEGAQALQDRASRDLHFKLALTSDTSGPSSGPTQEGALLRAARWALHDQDADAALASLAQLPQGASRRTVALRLKLKAARRAGQIQEALETARLLAKHRAFSPSAGQVLVRGLAQDALARAHDRAQLQRVWDALEPSERAMPELAVQAAQRLMNLRDASDAPSTDDPSADTPRAMAALRPTNPSADLARSWLLPVWNSYDSLPDGLRVKLALALQAGMASLDAPWLARLEAAQQKNPRDAVLLYLAGMACQQRQLWGKAQQLLKLASLGLQDSGLLRSTWRALAELAEQRGDAAAAQQAYQRAAGV